MRGMHSLAIDIETYSEIDIAKSGLYKYAESCELLLLAYAFDDEPVQIVDFAMGEKLPAYVEQAIFSPGIIKTAFNAAFEICVLSKFFGKSLNSMQWQCTMVQGLSLGLPSSLNALGSVLQIDTDKRKLAEGKKLVQFFSKPRKSPAKSAPPPDPNLISLWDFADLKKSQLRNMPADNMSKWLEFKEYCKRDVEAERAIRQRIAQFYTTSTERHLWKLDQTINGRGVWIDMNLVEHAIKMEGLLKTEALKQGQILTDGVNLNSTPQMLNWLSQQLGAPVTSVDKKARETLLQRKLPPNVREVLLLKETISKISVKKFQSMQDTACKDHRARGMFQFYGANRTGRWAGRHIQLQNLPQNHMDDLDYARRFVLQGNVIALQIFFVNPLDVLSQLIRTAFVAAEGNRFIVADFSAIEARVLAWLANEKWRMEVFKNGGDIYCASATAMFKVPVEKHGVNHELRAKGKVAELACGYGGNVGALKAFGADKMGLSDAELSDIISHWRAANPNICAFWRIMEHCAKYAVRYQTKKFCQKGICFEYDKDFLFVKLPSGRRIAYYKPEFVVDPVTGFETLVYEGNLSNGRGWGQNTLWGGRLVENIVQAIARDCLAMAMLRLDRNNYKIVMHVHDEVICEMPEGEGTLDEVLNVMRLPINWAPGLYLDADGFETKYYKKE